MPSSVVLSGQNEVRGWSSFVCDLCRSDSSEQGQWAYRIADALGVNSAVSPETIDEEMQRLKVPQDMRAQVKGDLVAWMHEVKSAQQGTGISTR